MFKSPKTIPKTHNAVAWKAQPSSQIIGDIPSGLDFNPDISGRIFTPENTIFNALHHC
jgi:hypothetical protein